MKEKMECFVPEIRIPEWLVTYAEKLYGQPLPSPEERVRLTVELAAENVRRGTGGPFAAALFDCENRRLHSIGIIVVLSSGQSFAHAEMTAIELRAVRHVLRRNPLERRIGSPVRRSRPDGRGNRLR